MVVLSVLILLGAAAAVALLRNDDRAPLPPQYELRTHGFAVWPEDTVAEAMDACEQAEAWRLDPKATAFRFAREVLKYPEPQLNTNPIDPTPSKVRYLIGSDRVRGVFLGSVLDLRKYDRCWFIVRAENREDTFWDKISFRERDGNTYLVLDAGGLGQTEIGYGTWERVIEHPRTQDGSGPFSTKTRVLRLPEFGSDVTGHVMPLTRNDDGIATGIAAKPLGFIPN